MKLCLIRSLR